MGAKLLSYFELAEAHGGAIARMRLAVATGLSVATAKQQPDTPENIEKCRAAFQEITGAPITK